MNKKKTSQLSAIAFSSDFKNYVSCVTQIIAYKMFETGVTWKIIADLSITQHFITDCNIIYNYYNNYLEYQTGSREILLSYRKNILLLPFDNSFSKLSNIWYTPDLGFNLISIIWLDKKGVKMWL